MKIKAILASLISAVALQGATAGEWCPPAKDKCPVDCCEDTKGNVSFGYMSDYVFYGVRLARDSVFADVNYTFDLPCVGLPLTVGAWHLSSLGSGLANNKDAYGDETDLYASIGLPSVLGFDASIGYTHYLFPTFRGPLVTPTVGDSLSEANITISREVLCGVTLAYRGAHTFNAPAGYAPAAGGNLDNGSWVHTLSVAKSFDITDCLALDLTGGVLYTDNYWSNFNQVGGAGFSGWNNYYVQASLPIALSGCATLLPYVGYSGSPDGWVADGLEGIVAGGNTGANANDVFHGGVSIKVGF